MRRVELVLRAVEVRLAHPRVLIAALAAIVLLKWVTVGIVAHQAVHNGWLYFNGGDGITYWTTAWSLSTLHTPIAILGYGLVLIQAPFALVGGPLMLNGLPGLLVFNTVAFGPLGVIALYLLGRRLGNRLFGLGVATLWVVLPLLAIPYFHQSYHFRWMNYFLPNVMGLTTLGDMPSAVAVAWAAVLALRAADEGSVPAAVLGGVVAGFAIGIKPANALFLPAAAVCLLVARRFGSLAAYTAALAPALLTLAIWKERGNGHLTLGRPVLEAVGPVFAIGRQFSWNFLSRFEDQMLQLREVSLSLRVVEWFVLGGLIGAIRRSPRIGLMLVAWIFGIVIIKGSVGGMYTTGFWRLTLPGLPAVLLAMASVVFLVPGVRPRPAPVVRETSWRLVAWVAGVFALLPLVVVAAATRQHGTRDALQPASNILIPVSTSFRLSTHLRGGDVQLRWKPPYRGPTHVVYVVMSGRLDTQGCGYFYNGSPGCELRMKTLGVTRGLQWTAPLMPGIPRLFRVVLAAGFDAKSGDPLLVGAPAQALTS
jgi:hypothetical protein